MGKLVKMLSADGFVSAVALDAADIAAEARAIHGASSVSAAALGRLLAAASLMGCSLKSEEASVTLRVSGGGPCGVIVAVSDSRGNPRGYMADPYVELPLKETGKLDVGAAVGRDGTLTVMKDFGAGEPYIGQVPLVSGEIAEDVTAYFAASEQIPTACALGVLAGRDGGVPAAGGWLIHLLPGAPEETVGLVESRVAAAEPVTAMLARGMQPEEICRAVLGGVELELLEVIRPVYRCNCSRERVKAALAATGRAALEEMALDAQTQARCHFCRKQYAFSPGEIRALIAAGTPE